MKDDKKLCIICAWREKCNKKFSLGEKLHCPDFTKDITIKQTEEDKYETTDNSSN